MIGIPSGDIVECKCKHRIVVLIPYGASGVVVTCPACGEQMGWTKDDNRPSLPPLVPPSGDRGLARHRRADLLASLPKGSQRRIASRCRCSPATVSNVLNGKQTQHSDLAINIIRCAEGVGEVSPQPPKGAKNRTTLIALRFT